MTVECKKAECSIQLENDRARVRKWTFGPGTETGRHTHNHDFIVVPLTRGKLLLKTQEGESVRELEPGQSYFRNAGMDHNAINAGEDEIVLLEIELKP